MTVLLGAISPLPGRGRFGRALLFAATLVLLLTCPSPARAGGSPIGFVSVPAQGSLVVIALPNGGTLARIGIAGRPGAVAASVNGRHVLVVSAGVGAVTEINGVHPRVLRVFRGFARPVAVAFDYEPEGVQNPGSLLR